MRYTMNDVLKFHVDPKSIKLKSLTLFPKLYALYNFLILCLQLN